MIGVRSLKHVAMLAKHQNYRRAAEALYITQPALTKSIQKLEEYFGVPLFERGADGTVPTVFGTTLVEAAERYISGIEEVENEINLLKGLGKGQLKIGCDPFFAEVYMAPTLGNLLRKHPNLRIRAEVIAWDVILDQLIDRQLDLVIGAPENALGEKLCYVKVVGFPEIVYFCRPGHPLLENDPADWMETLKYPAVSIKTHDWWLEWFAESIGAQVEDDVVIQRSFVQCDNLSVLNTIVRNSDCVSGCARPVIQRELEEGTLCEVPAELPPYPELSFCLAFHGNRALPPALEVLIRELVNQAQEMGYEIDYSHSGF